MKQLAKIIFSVLVLTIVFACHAFGQCSANSKFLVDFNQNNKADGCDKFKFSNKIDELPGSGKIETTASSGELEVSAVPDVTIVSGLIGGTKDAPEGVFRISLQVTCAGAASPRISWGQTRLYYADPYDFEGKLVEAKFGFIGFGQADKGSALVTGADRTEGGMRVFPITDQVSCIDLDHRENSKTLTNIKGATRLIQPSLRLIGTIKYANPSEHPEIDPNDKRFAENLDEEFDEMHIPVGKLVTACFILNINPVGMLSDPIFKSTVPYSAKDIYGFQLIKSSSKMDKIIHTFRENDPHTYNPCETFTFDEVGTHQLFLRWQPYGVQSNRLVVKAVKK